MSKYESTLVSDLEMELNLKIQWRTRDGKSIALGDIGQEHLLRIIKKMERDAVDIGAPITDYFDDDNGMSGEVVVGRRSPLESLVAWRYEDFIKVYNYRFGGQVNETYQ